ncbi:hypothetical protein ABLE68_05320 [Nocardioides sp. CN2-186]|uniref:hypothetical protein n=1 Tax=Nocardioides tweenelious TaxID=3156607 RepID=UPI0032B5DC70
MTYAGRRTVLGLAAAATVGGRALVAPAAAATSDDNPLFTVPQRRLDARALRLWQSADLADAMATARASYVAGHGPVVSDEALARLDNAIAELAVGMLLTALNDDPFRPATYWLGAAEHSWGGLDLPGSRWAYDNPDTFYRTIPIDPDSTYEVVGQLRGQGTADLAFSLVNDLITQTTVGYVDGQTLRSRRRPSYRLTIGPRTAKGRSHHLQTTSDAKQLFVRSITANWAGQRPDHLWVRRTAGPVAPPARSDEEIVEQTRALLVRGGAVFGGALLGYKTMSNPANTMSTPGITPGALVSQANSFGHVELSDDQALVVRLDPAGADYVTLPVTDPWMVGVDPGRHQSSLNGRQASPDRDGTYTFVVSPTDPGVANWVSTAGAHEATIMARWQRLGSGKPAISTELVQRADLPAALPGGTRLVTPGERVATLARRLRLYGRRFETS